MSDSASIDGSLGISSGNLVINGNLGIAAGGIVSVDGGSVSASSSNIDGSLFINNGSASVGSGIVAGEITVGGGAFTANALTFTSGGIFSLVSGNTTVNGILAVQSGARLIWSGGTLSASSLSIAGTGDGTGAIFSTFTNNAFTGPVQLAADATIGVDSASQLALSGMVRGSASLTFSGGGTLLMSGGSSLTNLYSQGGNLNLAGGTHAITCAVNITNGSTLNLSTGTLTAATVSAGDTASSMLNQTGGAMTVFGDMNIGPTSGANGVYQIYGGSASAANIYLGGTGLGAGGSGAMTISSGASVTIPGTLKIWNTPDTLFTLNGGTLSAGILDTSGNPATFNWVAGTFNATNYNIGVDIGGPLGNALDIDSTKTFNLTNRLYIGTGTITQTGGSITTGDAFRVLGNASGPGTYTLSGGTLQVGTFLDVGDNGYTGILNQSGGSMVIEAQGFYVGDGSADPTSRGSYALSGNGTVSAPYVIIGSLASGTASQSSGLITSADFISVGDGITGVGSYTVSSTAQVIAQRLLIGGNGNGTYSQSGGNVALSNYFMVAAWAGSTGSAQISGGNLSTKDAYVGNYGAGVLTQIGGTLTASGNVYIGSGSDLSGNYQISNGSMTAANIYVGGWLNAAEGTGIFNISGGSVKTTGLLKIYDGDDNAVNLSGGSLSVGTIDTSGESTLLNWTAGTLAITNTNVDVDKNQPLGDSLTINSSKTLNITNRLYTSDGQITQTGGTITTGDALRIGVGSSSAMSGSYQISGGTATVGNFLDIGAGTTSGDITQTGGTVTVSSAGVYIGDGGEGTYSISSTGKLTTTGPIYLGAVAGYGGTFTISGGSFSTTDGMYVGQISSGVFTQDGGTASVTGTFGLYLGNIAKSTGSYEISAGKLTAVTLFAGVGGGGSFSETGGTVSVTGNCDIGLQAGGVGTASISDGTFSSANLYVGGTSTTAGGVGQLTISGGTTNVSSTLNIYNVSGDMVNASAGALTVGTLSCDGLISISGTASITAPNFWIGNTSGHTGSFNQTNGSWSSANNIDFGRVAGSTGNGTITGGTGSVQNMLVGFSGKGTVTQSGGTITSTGNLSVGGNTGAVGMYTISGGAFSSNGAYIGGAASTGAGGSGVLNIQGGTCTVTGTFEIFNTSGTQVNLTGGTLSVGTLNANLKPSLLLGNGTTTGWTAGTLDITGSDLSLSSSGALGSALTVGSAKALRVSGASHTLTIVTGSLLSVAGGSVYANTVNNGGEIALQKQSQMEIVNPLINSGLIDISGGTLQLDNGVATSGSILGQIQSAYNHGNWNGVSGIGSSIAITHPATAVGYISTGAKIILNYTWVGDANLDGVVNSSDLAAMTMNGSTWNQGDFNYDGAVNADDYALFMLGATASNGENISMTLPEPIIALPLAMAVMFHVRRRRICD